MISINSKEKRKAFTLIELLAVIVILAVISLIAAPVILNVIERARKGAFEDSAYGVVDAVKLYYADASLDGGISTETFTFPTDTKLKLTGEKLKSGSAVLEADGKVSLAISNGTWCAKKDKDEEKVTIVDYSVEDCEIGEVVPPVKSCFTVNAEDPSEITGYTCDEKDIEIPNEINGIEITKIGQRAFSQKEITSVVFPNTITSIASFAFYGNQLATITIPKTITSIENSVFQGNLLTSIEIPSNIINIGENAFSENQLTNVIIPNNVESIGEYAFYGNQLASITLPSNLTTIANSLFRENQLTSVTIPSTVTSVGIRTFENNQLASIDIPESVTQIGRDAFKGNKTGMTVFVDKVEDSITGSPWGAATVEWSKSCFTVSAADPSEIAGYICDKKEIKIPSSINGIKITKIGANGAFSNKGLTKVEIPEGITSIGKSAFYGNQLTSITIPASVTSIEMAAFYSNQITSLTIPKNIKSIGNRSFAYNQITSVEIPNGVEKIEEGAFKGNQLSSVTIPASVTSIGNETFSENKDGMKVIINKAQNSITGSPWGASSVQWNG